MTGRESSNSPDPGEVRSATRNNVPRMSDLAAEAFVYGFPMVFDLQQVERFTDAGIGNVPASPLTANP